MGKSSHLCSVIIIKIHNYEKSYYKKYISSLLFGMLTSSVVGNNFENMNREIPLIFIKNNTGKIIYEKPGNIYSSKIEDIDFSHFKNGYYTLEINKDFQIEIKPFTIISGEVIFHKTGEKTIFKPVIRAKKNKILISKLNFEAFTMKVDIYYEDELILSDNIKGEKLIEKTYSLQKEKKGNYKVITTVNDRRYTKEFSL